MGVATWTFFISSSATNLLNCALLNWNVWSDFYYYYYCYYFKWAYLQHSVLQTALYLCFRQRIEQAFYIFTIPGQALTPEAGAVFLLIERASNLVCFTPLACCFLLPSESFQSSRETDSWQECAGSGCQEKGLDLTVFKTIQKL